MNLKTCVTKINLLRGSASKMYDGSGAIKYFRAAQNTTGHKKVMLSAEIWGHACQRIIKKKDLTEKHDFISFCVFGRAKLINGATLSL